MLKWTVLLVLSTLGLGACAAPKVQQMQHHDDGLTGYEWRLTDAVNTQGQRIDDLLVRKDTPVTLRFSDGHVRVANTCNHMSGGYRVEGAMLTVSPLMATLRACEPALNRLDHLVGQMLVGSYRFDRGFGADKVADLVLQTKQGKLMFEGVPTYESRFGEPVVEFYRIAPATRECSQGAGKGECLMVKEIRYDERGLKVYEADEWTYFYAPIDGYLHRSDVEQVVRLKRYTDPNPPADASAYVYVYDITVESRILPK